MSIAKFFFILELDLTRSLETPNLILKACDTWEQ